MDRPPEDQFPPRPAQTPASLADLPPLLPPDRLLASYQQRPSDPAQRARDEPAVYDIPTLHDLPTPRASPAPSSKKRRARKERVVISLFVLMLFITAGLSALKLLSSRHLGKTPIVSVTATQMAHSNTGVPGQPLQAGENWAVTVAGLRTTARGTYPPKTGETYLAISLTLKNVSTRAQFVASTLEFTLMDTGDGQYNEAVTDASTGQAVDGHVAPGQILSGQLTYEVPQTQHHFILTFHYGLASNSSASVSWPLTA